MSDQVFMTPEEASAFLKISKSALAKLRLTGDGPRYLKAIRRITYRKTDLVSWIEAKAFVSTSEYDRVRA
jgi:hypothetical protein